jgi:hypothetical protein
MLLRGVRGRFGRFELGARLGHLTTQGHQLPFCDLHIRLGAQHRSCSLIALVHRLLVALVGLDTLVAQTLVAVRLVTGVLRIGLGADQLRAALFNRSFLLGDLALGRLNVRVARIDVCRLL